MKLEISPSQSSVTSSTNTSMATDVSLSHTIDDDITFERVRHMPKRTQFVSTHRKLSWQYDKEMKQHERDQKISHVELSRAKTAMAEKFVRLQDAKKEVERQKCDSGGLSRRYSSPNLPDMAGSDQKESAKVAAATMKHSHSASCFPEVSTIPEDSELTKHSQVTAPDRKVRTVVVAKLPDGQSGRNGRRATIAEGMNEGSSMPPHLIRRLSEFMDSTSGLLLKAQSSSSKSRDRDGKKQNDQHQYPSESQFQTDLGQNHSETGLSGSSFPDPIQKES